MADKSWKQFERNVAKLIGGKRIPVSGRQEDHHGADIEHPWIHPQCKFGYGQPTYLRNWIRGAEEAAEMTGKEPVVFWKARGVNLDDTYVIMTLPVFRRIALLDGEGDCDGEDL